MSYLHGYYTTGQLGFMVAAAAPVAAATGPLAPAVLGLAALASFAAPLLPTIGAGRKEADQIVPEQNKLGQALADVDTLIRNGGLGASDIRQIYNQLSGMWQTFLNFIYQDSFIADGDTRASDGARATMEPQVNARLQTLIQMLNAVLGKVNPPQQVQSGINQLEFRNSSDLNLPQSGFLQPGAVAPTGPMMTAPSGGVDSDMLTKLAIAGAVVFFIARR